ncbi:hypothetical protein BCF11_2132 [Collimonas sp. PA-H2]|uniref:hypothetical protein n=1 Tax=Collimonas sp. PA-H2 TaxID=1881062 RepID=UPI000BF3FDF1|nr:hypothetical protein [Collimonas sp. PA-H2]PFH09730.1 hypothetical protein BCF11_2132 [Collimonas sp. PA-H2]
MEKLVNIIFEIINWYENTAVRKDDPSEIADLKIYQRRAVATGCLVAVLAGLSMFVDSTAPESGTMSVVIAPLFSFIDTGVTYALLAATIVCLYYAGRSLYIYTQIGD